MLEIPAAITLSVLFLIFFRPGKTPLLESQLLIIRPGQYQITLAPKLNVAQPFIEAIAKRIGLMSDATNNSGIQFFSVRDREVNVGNSDVYLLAIAYRNGMLYFQAVQPSLNDQLSHLQTITLCANAELAPFPDSGKLSEKLNACIVESIQSVARERSIDVALLAE